MNQIAPRQQGAVAPQHAPSRVKFDLMDPNALNHIQRIAGIYAASPLFPEHLRKGSKETAIANAVLVMNIAERLREDPLTVAQNIYFVSGRPGWSASYMIAKANQFGVFKTPIEWKVEGKGESLVVTAYAVMNESGKEVEMPVSFETAKKEGWTRNSKYASMPEVMLRYRSATALIRAYCPEVMIGMPPVNEVEDEAAMRDVTPTYGGEEHEETQFTPLPVNEVEDAETVEDETPAPRKVNRTPPPPAQREPKPEPEKEPEPEQAAEETPHDEDGVVQEDDPEPEQEAEQESETDEAPASGDVDLGKWEKLVNGIIADMEQIGDFAPIDEMYHGKLAQMKKEDRPVFDYLARTLGVDMTKFNL